MLEAGCPKQDIQIVSSPGNVPRDDQHRPRRAAEHTFSDGAFSARRVAGWSQGRESGPLELACTIVRAGSPSCSTVRTGTPARCARCRRLVRGSMPLTSGVAAQHDTSKSAIRRPAPRERSGHARAVRCAAVRPHAPPATGRAAAGAGDAGGRQELESEVQVQHRSDGVHLPVVIATGVVLVPGQPGLRPPPASCAL